MVLNMLFFENNQSRAMLLLLLLGLLMICNSVKPCTYLSHLLKLTKKSEVTHLFWTMDHVLFFVCLKFIRSVNTGILTNLVVGSQGHCSVGGCVPASRAPHPGARLFYCGADHAEAERFILPLDIDQFLSLDLDGQGDIYRSQFTWRGILHCDYSRPSR